MGKPEQRKAGVAESWRDFVKKEKRSLSSERVAVLDARIPRPFPSSLI